MSHDFFPSYRTCASWLDTVSLQKYASILLTRRVKICAPSDSCRLFSSESRVLVSFLTMKSTRADTDRAALSRHCCVRPPRDARSLAYILLRTLSPSSRSAARDVSEPTAVPRDERTPHCNLGHGYCAKWPTVATASMLLAGRSVADPAILDTAVRRRRDVPGALRASALVCQRA